MAYTIAGGAASAFVGAGLGAVGTWLSPEGIGGREVVVAVAVAIAAIARELGWISFPLPQLARQTRRSWANAFPRTLAATLWGLDLGLIFTTWLTFAGVWLLAVLTLLVGEPAFGAALLALYWLGRALSVWIAPLLMPDATATPRLLAGITAQHRLFQRLHALGLVWSVVVLISWLAQGNLRW